MEKVFIPIDRASIKENPDAGRNTYHVPGMCQKTADGWIRPVQTVYSIRPEPAYFYKYAPTQLQCDECGEKFSHTKLLSDVMDDGDGGEIYSERVCPKCGAFECCWPDFERLTDKEMSILVRDKNVS